MRKAHPLCIDASVVRCIRHQHLSCAPLPVHRQPSPPPPHPAIFALPPLLLVPASYGVAASRGPGPARCLDPQLALRMHVWRLFGPPRPPGAQDSRTSGDYLDPRDPPVHRIVARLATIWTPETPRCTG